MLVSFLEIKPARIVWHTFIYYLSDFYYFSHSVDLNIYINLSLVYYIAIIQLLCVCMCMFFFQK
ncbi:hypothetical protein Lalb_Chr16g0378991 [Lupinus albus]|uniref:Uncharacterized protein n=1 Tax=Lupinus albus TaxID=3870 RepID=A0A6A4NWH3_LUPAL|nr:hypothetical protein Lalb_Chr16g0378991 [Lupinus albus]